MEDQVPFKVYAFWREGSSKPEVRRFGVDKNVVTNYNYLFAKIQEVYPKLKESNYSIYWKDEDGDDVKLSSDEEVMTMLTALRETVVKLYVHVEEMYDTRSNIIASAFVGAMSDSKPAVPPVHIGVCCDACESHVVGFRYKCVTCDDFDLCSKCEYMGAHSEHCLVRIPSPQMSLQVIRDSIKKSRSFLKHFAVNLQEIQKKQKIAEKKSACVKSDKTPPSVCPYLLVQSTSKYATTKDRHEERQEKRQERHEKRQERRDERKEERRERRDKPREPHVGWMDVFSKYVDQFANLAADHVRAASAAEGAQQTPQQTADLANNQPTNVEDGTSFEERQICNELSALIITAHEEATKAMANTEAKLANQNKPSFTPQSPANTQGAESQPATNPGTASSAPQDVTPQQAPIAPQAQINAQAPITQQTSVPQEAPSNHGVETAATTSNADITIRDSTPDKTAEDWTMINEEKDLEPETGATAFANPAPVDNNLPEEFQPRPGASHGLIYPPLNTATAVCDPKDPVKAETGASAPRVQYQAPYASAQAGHSSAFATVGKAKPPAPTPVTEERHHHVPHIDAAIRQMIAMGFTNEGGWLTQLLESKDGNIAAVLDLLTPVNPHKK